MVRPRQRGTLRNAEGIDFDSGQKEPGILRQLDLLNLHRIEVLRDLAETEFERTGDRLLRCISHAASQRSAAGLTLDGVPSTTLQSLFQVVCVDRPREVPAFVEFFRRQAEAFG